MDEQQALLSELLKLKLLLVQKLNSHVFKVATEDMLAKVNEAISRVEKK